MVGIATALADSRRRRRPSNPGEPTEILQPVTEAVGTNTDIAFITIMAPDRTRFTHTDPNQIGGQYIGTIEPALRGETFTEVYTGTLGPSIRAVAPVRDGTGRIVGLVSAGILQTEPGRPLALAVCRRSPRSAWPRWPSHWSGCGRSGAGCCARRTGCGPTSCG